MFNIKKVSNLEFIFCYLLDFSKNKSHDYFKALICNFQSWQNTTQQHRAVQKKSVDSATFCHCYCFSQGFDMS